ncbi:MULTISPECIES: hypothetical protein [Marinomonas]|uniref:Outer membrane protein beta-barrel domain-containing protein n=1 Tax=Marinomonas arctica TaxID=383750 RepID=A0A7H1J2Q6_9GAMM|nr:MULTISPECIES: hypothetical protein [Marinomonas]MCS7486484.1 hypothetical protein [Marinomonas sp. BSi20414]QNT04772.1 hypothetical protein IBG28_13770 [Marinomonas arctica]GGN30779.1 hypothetical protein GCM10011350_23920 [Marinomonas arctica]
MKKLLLSSLAATAFTLSMTAHANTFTYLDYGFGSIDPDYTVANDDFSSLSGAFEFGKGAFIAAESTEYGSIDLMAIGAGVYAPVGRASSLFGILQFVDVDWNNNNDDDTGYRLTAGLRSSLADRLEIEGKLKYDDVFSETDSSFALGLRFYITRNFSIAANYDVAEINENDQNAMFASLRLSL